MGLMHMLIHLCPTIHKYSLHLRVFLLINPLAIILKTLHFLPSLKGGLPFALFSLFFFPYEIKLKIDVNNNTRILASI